MTAEFELDAETGQSLHLQATHLEGQISRDKPPFFKAHDFQQGNIYLAEPPPQSASLVQSQPSSKVQGPGGNCEAKLAKSSMQTSCIKHRAPVSGFFVALLKSKLTLF